jgi:hypothetical protein
MMLGLSNPCSVLLRGGSCGEDYHSWEGQVMPATHSALYTMLAMTIAPCSFTQPFPSKRQCSLNQGACPPIVIQADRSMHSMMNGPGYARLGLDLSHKA